MGRPEAHTAHIGIAVSYRPLSHCRAMEHAEACGVGRWYDSRRDRHRGPRPAERQWRLSWPPLSLWRAPLPGYLFAVVYPQLDAVAMEIFVTVRYLTVNAEPVCRKVAVASVVTLAVLFAVVGATANTALPASGCRSNATRGKW